MITNTFTVEPTVKDCMDKKYEFIRNVYGDEINAIDCRSLWRDANGNTRRCSELFVNEEGIYLTN